MLGKKMLLISLFIALFLSTYIVLNSLNTNDFSSSLNESLRKETSRTSQETRTTNRETRTNQYYYVYLKQDNGNDTSFVPPKLNPSYKLNSALNISISFNDDGSVVEDEKMILVYNYTLSNNNKEKIKRIVGEKNYDDVLKEIQEIIDTTKDMNLSSKKEK